MSEKDRARIHRAIDKTLSGLPEDPFLPQRIAARAAQSGKGVRMRNHKWMIVLAVVIVMSLTAAVASEMFSGTVDWDGNLTPDAPLPTAAPTMVPEGTEEEEIERGKQQVDFERANEPAAGQAAVWYDLTMRDTPNGGSSLFRSAADMQQFESMMTEAEGFAIPVSIPEGYEFQRGLVYYGCKPEGEFQLVKTVDSDDGFRVEFYELDDKDAVIRGYDLQFLKKTDVYDPANPETWEMISIYAFLANDMEEAELYVRNSTSVSTVTVPGMEKAVYVQGMDYNTLDMYGLLPQPVTVRSYQFFDVVTEHQISINVRSDATMAETLAMFGGK